MKIAIIGLGFVGNALLNALKGDVEVAKIDPKLKTSIKDLKAFNPQITFISVPTPMNKDLQDLSILNNVIKEIKFLKIKTLVVLKSTVIPPQVESIEKEFEKFVYNPEFLKENDANSDFIKSPFIIFGGKKQPALELSDFYKKYTKCETEDHVFVDAISASLIKYSINSFLASKVIFFNQLFEIFSLSGSKSDWHDLIDVIAKDPRIGSSHMMVPGHDGRKGFGGACFPKDTYALYKYSESLNVDFSLLKSVMEINNKIRMSYNDVTERESMQNIDYENS